MVPQTCPITAQPSTRSSARSNGEGEPVPERQSFSTNPRALHNRAGSGGGGPNRLGGATKKVADDDAGPKPHVPNGFRISGAGRLGCLGRRRRDSFLRGPAHAAPYETEECVGGHRYLSTLQVRSVSYTLFAIVNTVGYPTTTRGPTRCPPPRLPGPTRLPSPEEGFATVSALSINLSTAAASQSSERTVTGGSATVS